MLILIPVCNMVYRKYRAPLDQAALDRAVDDLVVALRACHGHPAGAERMVQFLNFGAAGPDGKPGTKDDLADPLEAILSEK